MSINQTSTRSLDTSVTAFLAVLPLAIRGGTTVASFAVPMALGIVIAACSSVFIAAPILLFLGNGERAAQWPCLQPKPPHPSGQASTRTGPADAA